MTDSIKVVGGTDDPQGSMTAKDFLMTALGVTILVAGLICMVSPLINYEPAKEVSFEIEKPELNPNIVYAILHKPGLGDDEGGYIFRVWYNKAQKISDRVMRVYLCEGSYYMPGKNLTQSVEGQYINDVGLEYLIDIQEAGCKL